MKRAMKRTPKPVIARICTQCGEPFETSDDIDRCPGGCLHRWGRGNYDPVDWDDDDAFRKAPKESNDA